MRLCGYQAGKDKSRVARCCWYHSFLLLAAKRRRPNPRINLLYCTTTIRRQHALYIGLYAVVLGLVSWSVGRSYIDRFPLSRRGWDETTTVYTFGDLRAFEWDYFFFLSSSSSTLLLKMPVKNQQQ